MIKRPKPKHPLDEYRRFIREATAYVSLVSGRRLRPEDADRLTDSELTEIALQIDERATALKKNPVQ